MGGCLRSWKATEDGVKCCPSTKLIHSGGGSAFKYKRRQWGGAFPQLQDNLQALACYLSHSSLKASCASSLSSFSLFRRSSLPPVRLPVAAVAGCTAATRLTMYALHHTFL